MKHLYHYTYALERGEKPHKAMRRILTESQRSKWDILEILYHADSRLISVFYFLDETCEK